MASVPFVDAHVHFWQLGGAIRYPWLMPPFDDAGPNGSVAAIARDHTTADYRAEADRWDVRGCVHVEAGAAPDDALAETRWLERVAANGDLPTAIVAHAPLESPDLDALLAAQAEHRRVRGIRQIVNWHADAARSYTARDLTLDDRWRAGFGRLARHDLSFDLQCYPDQMAGLVSLFRRHPDVPVIVNHLGMPILAGHEGLSRWRRGMRLLAACGNVSVKLSGFGFVARDWAADTIGPLLREVVDLFGVRRCMAASDSPTDLLFAPFERTMATLDRLAAGFSADERRDLFGCNADRIYRLGLEI